jgi:hypothetical protein
MHPLHDKPSKQPSVQQSSKRTPCVYSQMVQLLHLMDGYRGGGGEGGDPTII